MEESQKEIQKQFREQQLKYIYYIIAICISAIGFSVYQTKGQILKFSQIPLAFAIIFWGLSVYFGLKFLKSLIDILYVNNSLIDVLKGNNPISGKNPEAIEIGVTTLKEIMEEEAKKGESHSVRQQRLFYLGIILFIIWHVLEMYINGLT